MINLDGQLSTVYLSICLSMCISVRVCVCIYIYVCVCVPFVRDRRTAHLTKPALLETSTGLGFFECLFRNRLLGFWVKDKLLTCPGT